MSRKSDVISAVQDALPVALGYIPLGTGMGMVLVSAGIDWWWAPVFAVVMFAGSMQYMVVPMIAAGDSLIAIALATLLIQFRHIFYGISFPLDRVKSKLGKLYSIHSLTDEVYAVIASKPRSELSTGRILWTQFFAHLSWVLGCTLGALAGLAAPIDDRISNFVMTSLFVVLMIESYKANPARVELILAAVIAGVSLILPSSIFLMVALAGFTVMLLIASRVRKGKFQAPDATLGPPTGQFQAQPATDYSLNQSRKHFDDLP